jgi:hypothetical protein
LHLVFGCKAIGVERFFDNPGRIDIGDEAFIKEEAMAMEINRPVAGEKEGVGLEICEYCPHSMNLNNVWMPVLQDVCADRGEPLVCEHGVAEETEVDDLYVMSE